MSAVKVYPSVLKSYLTVLSMIASHLLAVPCLWTASVDWFIRLWNIAHPWLCNELQYHFQLWCPDWEIWQFTHIHFTMSSRTYKRLYLPASIHVWNVQSSVFSSASALMHDPAYKNQSRNRMARSRTHTSARAWHVPFNSIKPNPISSLSV